MLSDLNWKHYSKDSAPWFDKAGPVDPSTWNANRDNAHVRTVDQTVADVQNTSTPSRVDKIDGLIKYDLRRFEVAPGKFVQEYTVKLNLQPGPGVSAQQIADLRANAEKGVNALLNQGNRLPSGDQFHVRVDFDSTSPHQNVKVNADPVGPDGKPVSRSTQTTWSPNADPNVLAHEVLHYLGVPDEGKDTGSGARVLLEKDSNSGVHVGDKGMMGGGLKGPDARLLPRHLWTVESTALSQTSMPNPAPLDGSPTPPSPNTQFTPDGRATDGRAVDPNHDGPTREMPPKRDHSADTAQPERKKRARTGGAPVAGPSTGAGRGRGAAPKVPDGFLSQPNVRPRISANDLGPKVKATDAFLDLAGDRSNQVAVPHDGPGYDHTKTLKESVGKPPSFVVNSMVNVNDLNTPGKSLADVVESILADPGSPSGRLDRPGDPKVVFVVGVNAKSPAPPEGKRAPDPEAVRALEADMAAKIDAAMAALKADPRFNGNPPPVALVQLPPWKDSSFPFGTVRNETMVSTANQFAVGALGSLGDKGTHPYLSIQDFDTGTRTVPGGKHVFNHVSDSMAVAPGLDPARPMMISGGYRVDNKAQLVADVQARIDEGMGKLPSHSVNVLNSNLDAAKEAHKAEVAKLPKTNLTAAQKKVKADSEARVDQAQDNLNTLKKLQLAQAEIRKPDFAQRFEQQINQDMETRVRQTGVAPMLPYSPEPNLFLDASVPLSNTDVRFGAGMGVFAGLSQRLNDQFARELIDALPAEHKARYQQLQDLRKKLDAWTRVAGPDSPQAQQLKPLVEMLENHLHERESQLQVQAQNFQHPERGIPFQVDFVEGAAGTDLSRIALGWASSSGLPQSHMDLTSVASQFFGSDGRVDAEGKKMNDRGAKAGASLAKYRSGYDGHKPGERDPLGVREGSGVPGNRDQPGWEPEADSFNAKDERVPGGERQVGALSDNPLNKAISAELPGREGQGQWAGVQSNYKDDPTASPEKAAAGAHTAMSSPEAATKRFFGLAQEISSLPATPSGIRGDERGTDIAGNTNAPARDGLYDAARWELAGKPDLWKGTSSAQLRHEVLGYGLDPKPHTASGASKKFQDEQSAQLSTAFSNFLHENQLAVNQNSALVKALVQPGGKLFADFNQDVKLDLLPNDFSGAPKDVDVWKDVDHPNPEQGAFLENGNLVENPVYDGNGKIISGTVFEPDGEHGWKPIATITPDDVDVEMRDDAMDVDSPPSTQLPDVGSLRLEQDPVQAKADEFALRVLATKLNADIVLHHPGGTTTHSPFTPAAPYLDPAAKKAAPGALAPPRGTLELDVVNGKYSPHSDQAKAQQQAAHAAQDARNAPRTRPEPEPEAQRTRPEPEPESSAPRSRSNPEPVAPNAPSGRRIFKQVRGLFSSTPAADSLPMSDLPSTGGRPGADAAPSTSTNPPGAPVSGTAVPETGTTGVDGAVDGAVDSTVDGDARTDVPPADTTTDGATTDTTPTTRDLDTALLPEFVRDSSALGTIAVRDVHGAAQVTAAVPNLPAADAARIQHALTTEFETFLGDGRNFQVKIDGKWREINIKAQLDLPATGSITTTPAPGTTKVDTAVQSGTSTSEGQAITTANEIGLSGAYSQLAGPYVSAGAKAKIATPVVGQQSSTTTVDQRIIRSAESSASATVPVTFTVNTTDVSGRFPNGPAAPASTTPGATPAVPGPQTVTGSVDLQIPDTLTKIGESGARLRADGQVTLGAPITDPAVGANLDNPVPEAVSVHDPAKAFADAQLLLHPSVTALGAPGRAGLQDFLSGTNIRRNLGPMLNGWVSSPDLASAHGKKTGAVQMRATITRAELVGTLDTAEMRLHEVTGRASGTSASVPSGFGVSAGLGGVIGQPGVLAGQVGLVGGYSASTAEGGSAGLSTTNRTGVQLKGDVGVYKITADVEVRGPKGAVTVPVTTYQRIGLAEATAQNPDGGTPNFPVPDGTPGRIKEGTAGTRHAPPYLASALAAGNAKVGSFPAAGKVLGDVEAMLKANPGTKDLLPEWGSTPPTAPTRSRNPFSGWRDRSHATSLQLANQRELEKLSPTALKSSMDGLLGAGVTAQLKSETATTRTYTNITVRAVPVGNPVHLGQIDNRNVRASAAVAPKLDSSSSTSKGWNVGVEGRISAPTKDGGLTITPIPQAGVKYNRATGHKNAAGPTVSNTSLNVG
ncbi:hypothetical protein, partial [Actinosynnema sp.]|uniref:hypothetical protein n=1 Tax=Actinosynnema sp. TaxID=1872144 RepID=UPI003F873DD8